jgi:isopenicillin N synthase-like dioxygenase
VPAQHHRHLTLIYSLLRYTLSLQDTQQQQQQPPQAVLEAVRDAAMSWGFFQLVNHGVSQELLDEHYEVMRQ